MFGHFKTQLKGYMVAQQAIISVLKIWKRNTADATVNPPLIITNSLTNLTN